MAWVPLAVGGGVLAAGMVWANRPGPQAPKFMAYVVPDSERLESGDGAIFRHPSCKDGLISTMKSGAATLYETFQEGTRISGPLPCLGHRTIIGTDEKGKPKAGDFEWQTYSTVNQRAANFGSGLANLGLCPLVPGNKQSGSMRLLAFFAKNCPDWVIAEQGCFSQSVTTVPLYDTLGPDTVEMVINETELTTILCSPLETPKVIHSAPHCPTLKNIIQMGAPISEELRLKAHEAGLKLYHFSDVERSGKEDPKQPNPPKPTTLATFCYTSGTTGKSKGAMLTHGNILCCLTYFDKEKIDIRPTDRHLSYLPLAHVFERCIQALCFYAGARVGFYQGETLKIPEDILALRPTVFPSVPRLLNRFYDKIMNGVKEAGGTKEKLFMRAYTTKQGYLKKGWVTHKLWDKIVFKKLAQRVGLDQCRFIITGSAPIAPHVLDFLRICFSCKVLEGYGQTETSAVTTITHPNDTTTGHVGQVHPACEVKLVSVPDMGYLVTDVIHGKDEESGNPGIPCLGRGEICVRGNCIFKGYYKMEKQTEEALDSDGWCHTGDIGIWTTRGQLKIVDRKKNIFKLAQGEYIAPEKIENVYCKSALVQQAFVYGDSLQHQLVGIIVPEHDELKKWAAAHNISGTVEELCNNPEVIKGVLEDLNKLRLESKLFSFEHCAKIHMEPVPFGMDGPGLLTPTFKLKRDVAKKHYQKIIDAMYNSLGGVAGQKGVRQQ